MQPAATCFGPAKRIGSALKPKPPGVLTNLTNLLNYT
jgi:hypothetical protein